MLWEDIKDEYESWPKNDLGYRVSPDGGFWIKIGDYAKIGKQLTYIIGSLHPVYLYDPAKKMIGIGCNVYTIEEWRSNADQIGTSSGYNKKAIEEYKKYIELFASVYGW